MERIKLLKERYWKVDALVTEKKRENYGNSFQPLREGPLPAHVEPSKKLNEVESIKVGQKSSENQKNEGDQKGKFSKDNIVVSETPEAPANFNIASSSGKQKPRSRANAPITHKKTKSY